MVFFVVDNTIVYFSGIVDCYIYSTERGNCIKKNTSVSKTERGNGLCLGLERTCEDGREK